MSDATHTFRETPPTDGFTPINITECPTKTASAHGLVVLEYAKHLVENMGLFGKHTVLYAKKGLNLTAVWDAWGNVFFEHMCYTLGDIQDVTNVRAGDEDLSFDFNGVHVTIFMIDSGNDDSDGEEFNFGYSFTSPSNGDKSLLGKRCPSSDDEAASAKKQK